MQYDYREEQAKKAINYIASEYGAEPEFLWQDKYPSYAVFRNKENGKWFGAIMSVPGIRLGLEMEKDVEIIDLKFDKGQALDFIDDCKDGGILPAYHMNKNNWITVVFGKNKLTDEGLFHLVDRSFELSKKA